RTRQNRRGSNSGAASPLQHAPQFLAPLVRQRPLRVGPSLLGILRDPVPQYVDLHHAIAFFEAGRFATVRCITRRVRRNLEICFWSSLKIRGAGWLASITVNSYGSHMESSALINLV